MELLVVISIIAILAGMLLPALASAKSKATGTACLNNLKQLQTYWIIYVDEHEDRVPPNSAEWTNGVWRSTADSWTGNSSAPHDLDTRAIENGVLYGTAANPSPRIYRCPSDRAKAWSLTEPRMSALRTRSYSMNGNWAGRTNEMQKTVFRLSEAPDPGKAFVFIDEAADSIDDGHFLVWPAPDERWVNLPAARHGKIGVLSFSDGHVELWKWKWSKEFKTLSGYWKRAENGYDLADLRRVQAATLSKIEFPQ